MLCMSVVSEYLDAEIKTTSGRYFCIYRFSRKIKGKASHRSVYHHSLCLINNSKLKLQKLLHK